MRSTPSPFSVLLLLNVAYVLYLTVPDILDGSTPSLFDFTKDASQSLGSTDPPFADSPPEASPVADSLRKRVPRFFGGHGHGQTPLDFSASRPHPLSRHPGFRAEQPKSHSAAQQLVDPTLPHPTATCEVCVHSPDDPLCEYGLDNVRLSRSYLGSGHRVRKVLEKAMRGEAVKIGVIGGSVSSGHGMDTIGKPTWHQRWFERFKADFPGHHQLFDGSVPAMNSAFFSFCFTSLIPDDLDLYFIELDINNEALDSTYRDDDALLRGLLGLPQAPAVIRASVVATSFPNLAMGHTSSLIMATYYDTPLISIRNFLLPHFIAHPETSKTYFATLPDGNPDYRHISELGHNALADMLTLYFREQTCETRRRAAFPVAQPKEIWPQADVLGMVPRLYLWEPFSVSKRAPPVHAQCDFSGSKRRPLSPIADPAYTDPSWTTLTWNGKSALVASEVGTKVAFEFEGTKIGIYHYKQSGDNNPPEQPKPGRMGCWLDDDSEELVVVDSWHSDATRRSEWTMIKEDLPYGKHVLRCKILEESSTSGHEIRLFGVASQ